MYAGTRRKARADAPTVPVSMRFDAGAAEYSRLLEPGANEFRRQFAAAGEEALALHLKSERTDFLFDHGFELLDHENAIDRLAIAAQQLIRQRPRSAQFQHVCVRKRFTNVRIAGSRGDDAEAGVATFPAIDRAFRKMRLQPRFALDHHAMAPSGVGENGRHSSRDRR